MNVELSRRAGILHTTDTILDLDSAMHDKFVHAISKAKDFNSLDKKWKDLILKAEKEKGLK